MLAGRVDPLSAIAISGVGPGLAGGGEQSLLGLSGTVKQADRYGLTV